MSVMHNDDEQDDERWNRILYELKCKGQIECYDKISESHPEYPVIIYNYARKYKKRLKIAVSTTKVKSLKKRNIIIVLIGIVFYLNLGCVIYFFYVVMSYIGLYHFF